MVVRIALEPVRVASITPHSGACRGSPLLVDEGSFEYRCRAGD